MLQPALPEDPYAFFPKPEENNQVRGRELGAGGWGRLAFATQLWRCRRFNRAFVRVAECGGQ